jgi:hypothetical protein
VVSVEFQAQVKDGVIIIPDEYKQAVVDASTVKVTVSKPTVKSAAHQDLIDVLTQTPIPVNEFLTRDQANDRDQ